MKLFRLFFLFVLFVSCNSPVDNKIINSDTARQKQQKDSVTSDHLQNQILDTNKIINLCSYYEKLHSFSFPINADNLYYVFEKVKLDSSTLSLIKTANIIAIDNCLSKIEASDKERFTDDFTSIDNNDLFGICDWKNRDPNMDKEAFTGFLIIENISFGRKYLITYKLLNQKNDFIDVIDAILIYDHSASGFGGEESYDRQTAFLAADKITITENCYFKGNSIDRLNKYNVAINSKGKIILTLLSHKKRQEDKEK